jgi:hypothetical protein
MSFHAEFGWDPSQLAERNMFETLTNTIGYLHEQLRDFREQLKHKSTQVGVMSTTISQQNEELIKLKYLVSFAFNLPFGMSIHDFNENMRTTLREGLLYTGGLPYNDRLWSDMVEYLKYQIWDHVVGLYNPADEEEEEENLEWAVEVVKYSLNDLDCLFHFLDEDIKTNENVRAAMTELQKHIISKILEEYNGDMDGWMMDQDVTGIINVFKRHFPEV